MKNIRFCLFSAFSIFVSLSAVAQTDDGALLRAYRANSTEQLDSFFLYWRTRIPSLDERSLAGSSDTVQNIYGVFKAFYTPLDIQRLGGSEWGNDIYGKVRYLLVQNRILYGFTDSLMKGEVDTPDASNFPPQADHYDTFREFRPVVNFTSPRIVILTPTYERMLSAFLGDKHNPLGKGGIMNPAAAAGESARRKAFLEKMIKIWYGHWGGYWQLSSYPYAGSIVFDRTMKRAVVNFSMVYEGGYAYLKKVNGAWVLIKAKRTWIE